MMYYKIRTDYDPKTTGKRDGAFTIIKNRKSFETKEQEQIFNKFFVENYKNRSRVSYNSFVPWDCSQSFPITYFPRTTKIKENDFMAYGPYEHGIAFMISKRTYDILSHYSLPIHYTIPVKIASFIQNFVLLGLPVLDSDNIDFESSIFYKYGKRINYDSVQEYMSDKGPVITKSLRLKCRIQDDVVHTTEGIFLSQRILMEFEQKGITGFIVSETTLETD